MPTNDSELQAQARRILDAIWKVNTMQAKLQKQLSPADVKVILRSLPERIQAAPIVRAAKIEYPIAISIASLVFSTQKH